MREIVLRRCIIIMLIVSLNVVIYLSVKISSDNQIMKNPTKQFCDQCQRNSNQISSVSKHLLCLIVPYRDRFEELLIFAPEMKKYLSAKNISHKILIMNQIDIYRFNRASLINVGYHESLSLGCDYLSMHDIDLLPLNPNLDYDYTSPGTVYHVAAPQYHPKYHYEKFLGEYICTLIDFYSSALLSSGQ